MTLGDIQKSSGIKLNQWDKTNNVFIDGVVTASDITFFSNQRIRDLYLRLINSYPNLFEREAYGNNYTTAALVSASSSGTSLVTTTALFDNSMVGETVYDQTLSKTATITAFTDSTHVTVNTTISSWTASGDTICVLNGRIPSTIGDLTDNTMLTYVGLKYATNDQFYTRAEKTSFSDLYELGPESYDSVQPKYYIRMGYLYIVPKPTTPVTRSIYVRYIEQPADLSSAGDVISTLPSIFHEIIFYGVLEDAFEQKGDIQTAQYYRNLFEKQASQRIQGYRPFAREKGFYVKPRKKNVLVFQTTH